MNICRFVIWVFAGLGVLQAEPPPEDRATLIVVTGHAGAAEYATVFDQWAAHWRQAGEIAGAEVHSIGGGELNELLDKERLQSLLETEAHQTEGQLWLVLNGHGTFDGRKGKFNLRERDISSEELAEWLQPCQRPLVVVNAFSASAPFIWALSGTNRVIISATKSGYEINYSRFGGYLAASVNNLKADLDKDGQVSLLEAFLMGARDTEEFYSLDGRLASEHALIDDNGDQRGTEAHWYRGVGIIKKAKDKAQPDGRRAHQFHLIRSDFERLMPKDLRERRDTLELKLLKLRDQKTSFNEVVYYEKLEAILLELSELYATAEAAITAPEPLQSPLNLVKPEN